MRQCVLFAALLLIASPLHAQKRGQAPPARRLTWDDVVHAFDAYAVSDSIVGASILMIQDGQVRARHDYGFADRAHQIRTGPGTIYHWASITKTLTAIAVLQLRDRGLLSLDDPITRWVPELRQVHDTFGSIDAITLRMLLGHTAGFQDPTWPYKAGKPWEPFEPTRWEQLVSMMPYQEILFKSDSRFGYSNPGFIYLARVIEEITGDPWETYVAKNIWGPLGLEHSYFGTTPYWLADRRSNNYTVLKDSATGALSVRDNGRDFDPGITIPNGGWNAPLEDLATYLAFLTDATNGDTTRARRYALVLKRSSLEEMWQGRVPQVPGDSTDSIGLSFFIKHWRGHRFIEHTGEQAGFQSFFLLDPATRVGFVAAYNTANDADTTGGFFKVEGEAARLAVGDTVRTIP